MKKFIIKEEVMLGDIYYIIYIRYFGFFDVFYERWNTRKSVNERLCELNKE